MSRILVVTDALDTAESFVLLFTAMGHEARMALDGEGAIETAAAFAPRIVFLDLALHRLESYKVVVALRSQADAGRPTPIALTECEGATVNAATRAAGFDAYMCKPVDTMALIAVVTEIARRP